MERILERMSFLAPRRMKRVCRPARRQAKPPSADGRGTEAHTDGPAPRRRRRDRRLLNKGRRLGQAALFAAVRGIAYTLGTAGGAYLLYWLTQR